MSNFNFTQWIAVVGPLATMMLFLYNKIERSDQRWSTEMKEQRQHWAELLKGFYDFKNVTVERFAKLENDENNI